MDRGLSRIVSENPLVLVLWAALLGPCLLFALGYISAFIFLGAFLAAILFCVLVVNFELGFLVLVFLRSSLDYVKFLSEAGGTVLNVAGIAGLTFIALGFFHVLYKKVDIFRFAEVKPFIIFLTFSSISIFFSQDKLASVADLLRLWSIFFVYVVVRDIFRTERQIQVIFNVVILSSLIPIFLGYYQIYTGELSEEGGRIAGAFYHPNTYGSYLVIVLIVCVSQYLEKKSFLSRKLLVILIPLLFLALVFTYGRGAWIACVLAVGMMAVLRYRKLMWIFPVALFAVAIMIPTTVVRIKDEKGDYSHRTKTAWEWRVDVWNEAAAMWKERPLFGHGLKMFRIERGRYAHSDYLRLLAETGVAGLLAYLYLLIGVIWRSWRDFVCSRLDWAKGIQCAIFAMVSAFAVREIADDSLISTVVVLYIWLLIAVARNVRELELGATAGT